MKIRCYGLNTMRNMGGSITITLGVDAKYEEDVSSIARAFMEEKQFDVEFIKPKEKRSLQANAFAWVLIGKIADKTRVERSEVYKQMIRDVGGNSVSVVLRNDAVKQFCTDWHRNGIGWVTDEIPNGEDTTLVIAYEGSHVYDKAQMSRFIDLLVREAKDHGIHVEDDIDKMIADWEAQ